MMSLCASSLERQLVEGPKKRQEVLYRVAMHRHAPALRTPGCALGALDFDLPFALRPAKLRRLSGEDVLRYRELALSARSQLWARAFAALALEPCELKDELRRLDLDGWAAPPRARRVSRRRSVVSFRFVSFRSVPSVRLEPSAARARRDGASRSPPSSTRRRGEVPPHDGGEVRHTDGARVGGGGTAPRVPNCVVVLSSASRVDARSRRTPPSDRTRRAIEPASRDGVA